LWNQAQQAVESRRTFSANGKGNATGKFAGRNGAMHNLFTGLVFERDRPMHYQDKGKKSRPKLATESKDLNGTTPHRLDYQSFERAFLYWLDELDWRSVLDVSESDEIRSLEQRISTLALEIARNTDRIKNIGERLIDTPSDYLSWALLEAEQNLKAQTMQKSELEKSLASAQSRHRDLLSHDVVYSQLVTLKDPDSRAKLRGEIRRKVTRIDVTFAVQMIVAGHKAPMGIKPGTNRTLIRAHFVNEAERVAIFQENEAVLLWLK
jgi:hypothetical protein